MAPEPSADAPAPFTFKRTPFQRLVRRSRIPLGIVFSLAFLLLARPTWTSLLVGLPFVVAGLWLRGYASGYLSKNKSLATDGPYAHTRNPLYLGSLTMALGFALAGARWDVGIVLMAAFFAIYIPTIISEEKYLRAKFPEFDAYVAAVPRLLPRLTPARLGEVERGGFSKALYIKHREYQAAIGVAAGYLGLIAHLLFHF